MIYMQSALVSNRLLFRASSHAHATHTYIQTKDFGDQLDLPNLKYAPQSINQHHCKNYILEQLSLNSNLLWSYYIQNGTELRVQRILSAENVSNKMRFGRIAVMNSIDFTH